MRAAILRATLIAGEGQSEPNAIGDFVDCVLGGEKIDIYGDGKHSREWLHPIDLASSVRAASDFVAQDGDATCETFIVSSGAPISMADLAERIIAKTGKGELMFTPSSRQAFDLCSTSTKAADQLGWSPALDIDAIIDKYVEAKSGGGGE